MFIKTEYVLTEYHRASKLGTLHSYTRRKSIVSFMCDCCGNVFQRERGKMDPNRLSNSYYHVCSNCNVKKFAQQKAIEGKNIWDLPVSSLKFISQL